jgi:hypothetical protein
MRPTPLVQRRGRSAALAVPPTCRRSRRARGGGTLRHAADNTAGVERFAKRIPRLLRPLSCATTSSSNDTSAGVLRPLTSINEKHRESSDFGKGSPGPLAYGLDRVKAPELCGHEFVSEMTRGHNRQAGGRWRPAFDQPSRFNPGPKCAARRMETPRPPVSLFLPSTVSMSREACLLDANVNPRRGPGVNARARSPFDSNR